MRSMFYSNMVIEDKRKWVEPKIFSQSKKRCVESNVQRISAHEDRTAEINQNFTYGSSSELRLEDILQDILEN